MALNIKSERVERLLDDVAAMTGETKTEAVRRALEERRERLMQSRRYADPVARLWRVMEREVWPTVPASILGQPIAKADEDTLLGYGPDGV